LRRADFVGTFDDPRQQLGIPITHGPLVVNARGVREYVPLRAFFDAAAALIERRPETVVACVGLQDVRSAGRHVRRRGLGDRLILLPAVRRELLLRLFRVAHVSVSISQHDGVPNTLLEAMLAGCVPVVAPLESVAALVQEGSSGVVVADLSVGGILEALERAIRIRGPELEGLKERNGMTIRKFADRTIVGDRVQSFYDEVVSSPAHQTRLRTGARL
jgi:glycosyltransferase involved in cell wall biosynthesis